MGTAVTKEGPCWLPEWDTLCCDVSVNLSLIVPDTPAGWFPPRVDTNSVNEKLRRSP